MKTKEFIKRVEKIGYKTVKTDWYINIYDKYNITEQVASVNIYAERQLSISDAFYDLTKLLIAYAETPLDEREEEKKYYVKVFNGDLGYLSIKPSTNVVTTNDINGNWYQTQFTRAEIEKLKRLNNIAIDWDKVKLIEVDDDEN